MKIVEYYIDNKKHYILPDGKSYSEAAYLAMRAATEAKDEAAGDNDRKAGYYDKWYRYNRSDDGAAYDRGCAKAAEDKNCNEMMTIIPCLH